MKNLLKAIRWILETSAVFILTVMVAIPAVLITYVVFWLHDLYISVTRDGKPNQQEIIVAEDIVLIAYGGAFAD